MQPANDVVGRWKRHIVHHMVHAHVSNLMTRIAHEQTVGAICEATEPTCQPEQQRNIATMFTGTSKPSTQRCGYHDPFRSTLNFANYTQDFGITLILLQNRHTALTVTPPGLNVVAGKLQTAALSYSYTHLCRHGSSGAFW